MRACAIAAAALALALNAWGAPAAPFADGERVSFFGDSITHGGMYCADLQLFWDLRFPGSGVRLMNCGVAGGTAGTGLARWERDLLAQKPDRIFVMFGMNDVGHSGYEAGLPAEKAESMRSTSFARYATNMTEIAARAAAAGKRLVIVTPTPYDEYTANTSVKARPGCNAIGLARLAETCRTLAAARGAELVDLHAPLTALVERRGKFAFCRSDRVHPDVAGHIVMTAEMLSQMGVSPYVARVEIDAKAGSATLEQGAKVSRLNRAGNVLSLTYAPETLPFPTPPEYLAAAAAYPVTEKMNLEILKVTGLPKGLYSLDADGKELGRFTAEAFAEGVNLALLPTPSAAAAMDAWKVSRELATAQGRLRNLALLESIAARHGADPEDAGAVTAKMEEFAANLRKRGSNVASYYEGQVKNYRRDKPQEAEIRRLVEDCRGRQRAAGMRKVSYGLTVKGEK